MRIIWFDKTGTEWTSVYSQQCVLFMLLYLPNDSASPLDRACNPTSFREPHQRQPTKSRPTSSDKFHGKCIESNVGNLKRNDMRWMFAGVVMTKLDPLGTELTT